MYFRDLWPCSYGSSALHADRWAVPLRAIGWLEHSHPFTRGNVPDGFLHRLAALVEQTSKTFPHASFRGLHDCDLCAPGSPRHIDNSHVNLLIPGDRCVFAASGGVAHYVKTHGYRPPDEFIDALMQCPDCSSPEYLEALVHSNDGAKPPIETADALNAMRADWDSLQPFWQALAGAALPSREQYSAVAIELWPDRPAVDARGNVRLGTSGIGIALFDEAGEFIGIIPFDAYDPATGTARRG